MATISGKWKWNIELRPSETSVINIVSAKNIEFYSNNIQFSEIELMSSGSSVTIDYKFPYTAVHAWKMSPDNQDMQWYWVEDYAEMEFKTPQYIPDEAYEFITTYAIEILPPTITEQLQIIYNNQQKVYDAGYMAGRLNIIEQLERGPVTSPIYAEAIDDFSLSNDVTGTINDSLFGPIYGYNNQQELVPMLYNCEDDGAVDKYYYLGVATINNVEYDKWRKIEDNDWDTSIKYYVYTDRIIDFQS